MLVIQSCQFFATPRTVPCQAPLSMGFSRQEYWSGLTFPPPGDLPNPGIESGSPALPHGEIYLPDQGLNLGSLHWEHGVLVTGPPGKPPNGLSEFSCLHLSYGVSVSALLMFGARSFLQWRPSCTRGDVEQHPCPSFATSSSIPPTKDVSGHCAVAPRVGTTLCDNPDDGRGFRPIPCALPHPHPTSHTVFLCFIH